MRHAGFQRLPSALLNRSLHTLTMLALALVVAGTDPAVAGERFTLNQMELTLPDAATGWAKAPSNGPLMLKRDFPASGRDKRGQAIIQVLKPFSGNRAGLPAGMLKMAEIAGMQKEDILTKSYGKTISGEDIRVEQRCCGYQKGVSIGLITAGISADDRQTFLQLVLLNLVGERGKAAREDFAAMVRSLKLKPGDTEFQLVPASGDGGLSGTFTHLSTGLMPNAFGGLDFNVDNEILLFDKSGLYSRALPAVGEDIAAHCKAKPDDCGLYALKGGGMLSSPNAIQMREVSNVYGIMDISEKPFARDGDNLVIDKGDYSTVPPFEAGKTFNGKWVYNFASSGSMASSSGSIAVQRSLSLHPDGSYERTGWSGGSSTNEISGTTTGFTTSSNKNNQSGKYKVDGFAISLISPDGRTETMSLFAPDRKSDDLLVINGSNYLREKGK